MLWSEFVDGTKCRRTEHNLAVYQRVNKLYMYDDEMTKEEAYAIGKLWTDNALTEEEEAHNRKVLEELESYKNDLDFYKRTEAEAMETHWRYSKWAEEAEDEEERKQWKQWAKDAKKNASDCKRYARMTRGYIKEAKAELI